VTEPLPVEFRPEGTVRFSAGSKRVTLRRVTLNEWRRMREAHYVMSDDVAAAADAMTDASAAMEDTDETRRENNRARAKLLREFTATADDLRMAWVADVFATLGDVQLEDDDWEPWMVTGDFLADLARHLQTVPLARGES
jgi:hypothetical protein